MVPWLSGFETMVVVSRWGVGSGAFGWSLVAAVPRPGEIGEQIANTGRAAGVGVRWS